MSGFDLPKKVYFKFYSKVQQDMAEKRKIDAISNTRENDSDDDVSNEPIADFSLAFNGLDMEFVVNTLLYNVFKTFTVTKVEKILSEGGESGYFPKITILYYVSKKFRAASRIIIERFFPFLYLFNGVSCCNVQICVSLSSAVGWKLFDKRTHEEHVCGSMYHSSTNYGRLMTRDVAKSIEAKIAKSLQ